MTMTRRTTNVRIVLPSLLVAAFLASAAVMTAQVSPLSLALGLLIVVATGVAVSLEPLGGVVVGIAVSGAIVGASRTFGTWTEDVFPLTALGCAASVVAAWLAALLGSRVRAAARVRTDWSANVPAIGSLGLADATTGEALLADEILRATRSGTALSVLRLAVRPRPTGTPETQAQATRAVARVLDSTVHAIDLPFAYSTRDMAVILPGTDARGARTIAERIVGGLSLSTVRADGRTRQPLGEFATVSIGLAEFPIDGETARTLVDSADANNARARARAAARPSDADDRRRDREPGRGPADTSSTPTRRIAVGPGRPADAREGDGVPTRSAF